MIRDNRGQKFATYLLWLQFAIVIHVALAGLEELLPQEAPTKEE
jgi:hypothetical protein